MINRAFNITIFTVAIPILLQIIYIRYVSYSVDKNDFGNFVIISTFIVALSQIFLSVPSQAFMRFYNSSNKLKFINEFRTYLIGVNIIGILFVYFLYLFFGDRFEAIIYILMYVYFALSNNYALNQQIFLLNIDRKRYLILTLLESLSKFTFPIAGYYLYNTLESFLVGIVTGYVFSFILISFFLKQYPFKIEFNFENQKKYLLYAYPIVFSAIFMWSISFSDRYFIDYFVGTQEVAIYAILAQFAAFGQILGMLFSTYVNPIVLKKYEENAAEGLKLLKSYLTKLLYFSIFIFIAILIIPKGVFTLLIEKNIIYNDNYYLTFLILAAGIFLTVFQTAMSMYFILLKHLSVHAKIFIIASIINFLLNFYIIKYGIIAAALSTFIAYLVINILILIWLKKYQLRCSKNA